MKAMAWDMFLAELADTARAENKPRRPCIYCGRLTKAISSVCLDHDDLPACEVDAVLDELAHEHERPAL
jgi:hypothetical protein